MQTDGQTPTERAATLGTEHPIGTRVVADDMPGHPGVVVGRNGKLVYVKTDSGYGLVRTDERLAAINGYDIDGNKTGLL